MSYILDALKKMEHEKSIKKSNSRMVHISGELFRGSKMHAATSNLWKILSIVIIVAAVASGATWVLSGNRGKPEGKNRMEASPQALPTRPADAQSPDPASAKPVAAPALPASSPIAMSSAVPPKSETVKAVEQTKAFPSVVAPPADLKIAGIAWQEERKARRAVINGFLLHEGSIISGARITEIMHDRVRFATSGGNFELSMAASPPVQK